MVANNLTLKANPVSPLCHNKKKIPEFTCPSYKHPKLTAKLKVNYYTLHSFVFSYQGLADKCIKDNNFDRANALKTIILTEQMCIFLHRGIEFFLKSIK